MTPSPIMWCVQRPAGGVLCGNQQAAFVATPARFRQESNQCPKCAKKLGLTEKRKVKG